MIIIYNLAGISSTFPFNRLCPKLRRNPPQIKGCIMRKLSAVISPVILMFFLAAADARASGQELALFDQAYDYYLSYQPDRAVERFHFFLSEFPDSSAKDAALFWLGRSLINLDRHEEARMVFLNVKREFPDSPFLTYADKELNMMVVQATQPKSNADIHNETAEIHLLMEEKAKAEKTLEDMKAERDRLARMLEEEKAKKEEVEAKAERLDRELNDILMKLQELWNIRKVDAGRPVTPQYQRGEGDACAGKAEISEKIESNGKDTADPVISFVKNEGRENEPLQEFKKKHLVARKDTPEISGTQTLELVADEETWISVSIDNRESKERLMKPGTRMKWTAKNHFVLKIGNAGGTKIIFNGREFGPLGPSGKVVKLRLPSGNLSTGQKHPSEVL